ncbi:MAG: hypothetical protein HY069_02280 [Chlamydiia bacterium]|nr:hypothetical protein [Chlamydiia bacterium]
MKKTVLLLLLPIFAFTVEQLRVLPVNPTPEPETVVLAMAMPKDSQIFRKNPVYIQFRIDGYSLGAGSSQFPRSREIVASDMGQTVHIIIDNMSYFPVNNPAIDPFEESGWYYNTSYKFELPYELKEGKHVLRAFPARAYGESLKGDQTFKTVVFYVGDKKDDWSIDLAQPFITYNEPSEHYHYTADTPILLDFLVSNCELTRDGYKVKLSVDGKVNRVITSWPPYSIYGLPKGAHTIRLELLDAKDQLVKTPFNDVERKIQVH